MSKFSKMFNEYFYAWGDNDPTKEVLRYGKMVSLQRLHEYDDYKYFKPRRDMAGGLLIVAGSTVLLGVGTLGYKGVKKIQEKIKK